jgi:hypothetical protein
MVVEKLKNGMNVMNVSHHKHNSFFYPMLVTSIIIYKFLSHE